MREMRVRDLLWENGRRERRNLEWELENHEGDAPEGNLFSITHLIFFKVLLILYTIEL